MAATLIPPQAKNLFEVKSVWSHTHTYKSYTLTSCSMTQPEEDLFTSVCTRHGMRAVFPYICCHMRSLRCVRGCQNQFSISASSPFFHFFEDGGCHVRTSNYQPSSAIDNTKDRRINESLLVSYLAVLAIAAQNQ